MTRLCGFCATLGLGIRKLLWARSPLLGSRNLLHLSSPIAGKSRAKRELCQGGGPERVPASYAAGWEVLGSMGWGGDDLLGACGEEREARVGTQGVEGIVGNEILPLGGALSEMASRRKRLTLFTERPFE
jgi:hypothetical protein